jgi:hypothetical protein
MIWIILTVVVVFLIATGMPLIRDNIYERHTFEETSRKSHADDSHRAT